MKNIILVAFTLSILSFSSCKKTESSACINSKIEIFKNGDICETTANIKKYKFQNKDVYVFDSGNCGADMTSSVIDINCNILGYLGGITGNTKINNEDFSNAIFIKTIWEN